MLLSPVRLMLPARPGLGLRQMACPPQCVGLDPLLGEAVESSLWVAGKGVIQVPCRMVGVPRRRTTVSVSLAKPCAVGGRTHSVGVFLVGSLSILWSSLRG